MVCKEELTIKYCNTDTLRQGKTTQNSRILTSETPDTTETISVS